MSYHRDQKCAKPRQYRCRLLERDDVRGAVRRYGGRVRPLAPEFCDAYEPPAAPVGLTASLGPDASAIRVTWVNGTSPNVSARRGSPPSAGRARARPPSEARPPRSRSAAATTRTITSWSRV
jgi:hypothetical protein